MHTDLLLPTICIFPSLFFVGVILIIAKIAKKGKLSRIWISLPIGLAVAFVIILFLTVVYDSSGLIRFAVIISLIIASVISLIIAFLQGRKLFKELERNTMSIYFIGSLLTVASSGIAILGSTAIVNKCEAHHLQVGNFIVASLENYLHGNNIYPNSLAELDPKYINQNSILTCYSIRFISAPEFGEFHYKKCSSKITQLSIPEMGTGHFHVYDLINKKWYTSGGDTLEEWSRVTRCP